jgi:hypothetical protein
MLFIHGHRTETDYVGQGEFFCPHCRTPSTCGVHQIQKVKTVFFVETGVRTPGERFVECHRCKSVFPGAVLFQEPPTPEAALLLSAFRDLLSGTSVGLVQARLVERGFDPERAEPALLEMCGGPVGRCSCGRRYHPQVHFCSECNARF